MDIIRLEAKKGNLCLMNNVINQSTNLPACNNTVSTTDLTVGSRGFCTRKCQADAQKQSWCTSTSCNKIQDKTLDRRGIFCTECWGEHAKGKCRVCMWCQERSTDKGWQCTACRRIGNNEKKEKEFGGKRNNGDGNERNPPSP
jgi:hypothetical protein